jgi:hypothetical protein
MTATIERPETTPKPTQAPYYVNGVVDALFVGGLSIVVYIALRTGFEFGWHDGVRSTTVISIGVTLSWIVNWPHFAATATRLYSSPHTRRQFPVTTWFVPILIIGVAIVAIRNPVSVGPWFVKLFFIWSPYHFSGQTIGVALLYASRHGFKVTLAMRNSLVWFVIASYIHLQAKSEQFGRRQGGFYGIEELPVIGIPTWTVNVSLYAMYVMGAALVITSMHASTVNGRKMPWIMAVPVVAQIIWFQLIAGLFNFSEYVPFFHSLQYIYLAFFIQMREWSTNEDGSMQPMQIREFLARIGKWAVMIFVIGNLMFWSGPRIAAAMTDVTLPVATGIFFTAVQIHHFFVDGVIWKLRNPKVRASLSTSIGELTGSVKQ